MWSVRLVEAVTGAAEEVSEQPFAPLAITDQRPAVEFGWSGLVAACPWGAPPSSQR